ncbi:ATP-binding protein [Marmoricola sp. RAF53]|uniref:ATP-binding protein n=1 Tax=Marmoricola sp. RAF53 TaxID=3233059 RepID=UPI003F952F50
MSTTPPHETNPSDGERNAVVGFSAQFALAAKVVSVHLSRLEWIRLADPDAGVADDFQFSTGIRRHALQVKWSQYPGSFTWSDLAGPSVQSEALLAKLCAAWKRLRENYDGALTVHLCTNNYPSTSPGGANSPLGRVTGSPKHLAGFIARALEPLAERLRSHPEATWQDVEGLDLVVEWETAWNELISVSGLDRPEFARFLRDFAFTFVPLDMPALMTVPDDGDVQHLAATLQALVADPTRPVELSRSELLQRLGWTQRVKYRNPHRFPVPATYTANRAAKSALERMLDVHLQGYLALVGPAGSGKSTLIESLSVSGQTVRYYAFVPDAPDPLSGRGEAASFLHDLSLALDDGGVRRDGYGSDLSSQRLVLMNQIERAGKLFEENGVRTTIVVDGLDHIPREQNPTRSLLEELPAPAAIPPGVVFVLGSQTTDILPSPVRDALEDRVVEVPPLSDQEILSIAKLAGLEDWMLPGHIYDLVTASEGHPLALTYLIEELRQLEEETDETRNNLVGRILSDASDLGADLDTRYSHYLGSVLEDPDVLAILASISRLRIPVNLDWLSTWSGAASVNRFASAAATFFRRHEGEWTFIHNSFRRFLVEETAKVGGVYQESRAKELHRELADRCGASDDWAQFKDEELVQRFLAGQLGQVLDASTPEVLRGGLFAGRPHGVIVDKALVAVRAAANARDYPALVRSLMFLNELRQRHYVLDSNTVAKAMAEVDARTVIEHVVQGRTLRIDAPVAMGIASLLAGRGYLQDADSILRAVGGLQGLVGDHKRLGFRSHEWVAAISDWAEVTWRQSGLERVLNELDHLLPVPADIEDTATSDADATDIEGWTVERRAREALETRRAVQWARDSVHARCFDLADDVRDQTAKEHIAERISIESDLNWRARMHVISARSALADGDSGEVLRQVQKMLSIGRSSDADPAVVESRNAGSEPSPESGLDEPDDEDESPVRRPITLALRVSAAESLLRAGHGATEEFQEVLPPDTRAAWPSSPNSSDGLTPYRTVLATLRLKVLAERLHLYPNGATAAAAAAPASDPARARLVAALKCVAGLEADAIAHALGAGTAPDVAAMSDPVVRLLEVPLSSSRDWTGWYLVVGAASELHTRLIELAHRGGNDLLERTLLRFQAAWDSDERSVYWSLQRRLSVLEKASHFAVAADWVSAQLASLMGQMPSLESDPHSLAASWLQVAKVQAALGDRGAAISSMGAAARDGWGPGQHNDDNQLVDLLDWLIDSARQGGIDREEFIGDSLVYADRLVRAAGEAPAQAAEAAGHLITAVFEVAPALGCDLGESLCSASVIEESDLVAAIVRGAGRADDADVRIAESIATRLLMKLVPSIDPDVEDLVAARSAAPDEVRARFEAARLLWDAADSRRERPTGVESAPEATVAAQPLTTVLGRMRAISVDALTEDEIASWTATVDALFERPTPLPVAQALLEQAERLRLDNHLVGRLAGMVSRAGDPTQARAALGRILATSAPYGWMRHWDGGSRIKLFEAAITGDDVELVDLAAQDLAGLVASKATAGEFSTKDLRRILRLLSGDATVAETWRDVRAYLDVYAPPAEESLGLANRASDGANEELIRWLGRHLGHPVRIVDFGVRRILTDVAEYLPAPVDSVLSAKLADGGWAAEAALHVLKRTRKVYGYPLGSLSATVEDASVGTDVVIRLLAQQVLASDGRIVRPVPSRPLSGAYDLEMPELPSRAPAELRRDGVPYLDMTDPQHVVGPFDFLLDGVASEVDLDASTLIYRAAAIARTNQEEWLRGGLHSHADLLRARGNMHTYRPWAFMVGRRAVAEVLADLIDAGRLPSGLESPFVRFMVDDALSWIEPAPLDSTSPLPWRSPGGKDYASEDWCHEAEGAARVYADAVAGGALLAERSSWRWLDWTLPEEERSLKTLHGRATGRRSLARAMRAHAWEETYDAATNYPHLVDLSWRSQELVTIGRGMFADSDHMHWLALHPAVGETLGWTTGHQLFEWIGPEGKVRARTLYRIRGQLSHQPPSDAKCGDVWQVALSDIGVEELAKQFGPLLRRVSVSRTLPESRRSSREEMNRRGAAFVLRW